MAHYALESLRDPALVLLHCACALPSTSSRILRIHILLLRLIPLPLAGWWHETYLLRRVALLLLLLLLLLLVRRRGLAIHIVHVWRRLSCQRTWSIA